MTISVNTIPSINIPFTDKEGRISPIWHEFLRSFVAESVQGTIATEGVSSTITAGAGLTGGGSGNVTLNVGAGPGLEVNADDVAIDINGQTSIQVALDDEILVSDVSDNNSIRKTEVRNLMGLSAPGGDNSQMQYNNNGVFSGDTGFSTDGAGSVNIIGDLDVDNINLNGNTIITNDTNGDLTIDPNGTGKLNINGHAFMGDNNNKLYWTGGSNTAYHFGSVGGTPYMRGQDSNYQLTTTSTGFILGAGSGNTVTLSSSTGATVAGLPLIMSNTRFMRYTVAGITASTTQTQGQQQLTGDINEVSTVANVNDVVTLPTAFAGRHCLVINNGANTLQVFPSSADDLGAGLNTSTTITAGSRKWFVAFDVVSWEPVI